eukprot:gnl/MRDRNA2_/MRDRNA2_146690_c0_seq1.p1 gnl/MRDRNA2_/MRDRNA2_146690_c0~~gnl/MRDRNA2_/MRDRNA2_146690_c0_seq1.p1  ORF type:complete len:269 (-),score=42.92 gnl/MRDRNA2_/MRDRNA2_146690_c0_seq1:3-725(-)
MPKAGCSLETNTRCQSNDECGDSSRCSRRALLNGHALTHGTCLCEAGFCADASGTCKRWDPHARPSKVSLLAGKVSNPVASHNANTQTLYVDASEIRAALRKHIVCCIAVALSVFTVVGLLIMWCLGHSYKKMLNQLKFLKSHPKRLTPAEKLLVERPTALLQATSEPAKEIRVMRDPETKKFHAHLQVGDECFKGPGREDYRIADTDLQKFLRSYHMASEGKERENLRRAVAQLQQGGR